MLVIQFLSYTVTLYIILSRDVISINKLWVLNNYPQPLKKKDTPVVMTPTCPHDIMNEWALINITALQFFQNFFVLNDIGL